MSMASIMSIAHIASKEQIPLLIKGERERAGVAEVVSGTEFGKMDFMKEVDCLIRRALKEDIGPGDITTEIFAPRGKKFRAVMKAKEKGVVCGLGVAERVFKIADPALKVRKIVRDGSPVAKGTVLMMVTGGRKLLSAERTALNFVQHLSGIATATRAFAERVKGFSKIYDTRKTLPGLRKLEKYAVSAGGGENHRFGLYDAFLIKDNHISSMGSDYMGELRKRIKAARRKHKGKKIEIEAKTLKQADEFSGLDVDAIMLDNMPFGLMRKAVKIIAKRNPEIEIEISGNVGLNSLRRLKNLRSDRISAGKITHSARSLDISLDISLNKRGMT